MLEVLPRPSSLKLQKDKLPIENHVFLTPPNALRLEWQSQPGGSWEAEVHIVNFRNRLPELSGSIRPRILKTIETSP